VYRALRVLVALSGTAFIIAGVVYHWYSSPSAPSENGRLVLAMLDREDEWGLLVNFVECRTLKHKKTGMLIWIWVWSADTIPTAHIGKESLDDLDGDFTTSDRVAIRSKAQPILDRLREAEKEEAARKHEANLNKALGRQ
jgi:hypothetical protein